MAGHKQRLAELFEARLDDLRRMAVTRGIAKTGSVEQLRVQLIATELLSDWDFSPDTIYNYSNKEIGGLLANFGIKKTGSIKIRRQRLFLHLHHDPKKLKIDALEKMTRDDLHALCSALKLPRSGSKAQLLARIAGVLVNQEGSWGKIKKSLKRGDSKIPEAPQKDPTPVDFTRPLSGDVAPIAIAPTHTSVTPTISQVAEPIPDFEPMIDTPLDTTSINSTEDTDFEPMIDTPIQLEDSHLPSPIALPTQTQRASLDDKLAPDQIQDLRDRVERFSQSQDGVWSFEEETEFKTSLLEEGIPINHPRVSDALNSWLREAADRVRMSANDFIPNTATHDIGEEEGRLELQARSAELESGMRDFLLVGSIGDSDDVAAFIDELSEQGFAVHLPAIKANIISQLNQLSKRVNEEKNAVSQGPGSWRERDALRRLEKVRAQLLVDLDAILDSSEGDMVKARIAFEKVARELGLDLRLAAVSGRLHGLFDLQISLNESRALQDPRIARRERVVRILQHGAVHLNAESRKSLDRIERNIQGFEQVVEAILTKSESSYGEGEQTLLIRFLEQRGYKVNTAELRPRIVACGGVVGVEMGYLSPRDVPTLPSGISLSENEIDAVVLELRAIVSQFDLPESEMQDPLAAEEASLGESVANASETLQRVRGGLNRADELLARMQLSED
ncbi:MAG TPA: hypothetical protein EYQ53_05370 [Candidatus Poseidoniales archaeon]|jgi:hypothetical protein|nr:MAG: hypothetical protein CXT69_02070 [Euryarchaeota archaeon]HIG03792.1 hypothetical protein [Candidatus Poseidoniales archaeon]HIK78727.1 hypothetical protein [Candidatus Poseidoniales archaeon]